MTRTTFIKAQVKAYNTANGTKLTFKKLPEEVQAEIEARWNKVNSAQEDLDAGRVAETLKEKNKKAEEPVEEPEAPAPVEEPETAPETTEEPVELPEICALHSTYKRPIMLVLFGILDEAGIEYKGDKKGRINTENAVFRYRKGGIMVQGKGKFRKAHPEIVWEEHPGWDVPFCLNFETPAEAVGLAYPETIPTVTEESETTEEA